MSPATDDGVFTAGTPSGERSSLLGRERELAQLAAGIEEAANGRGRLFLITGEAGIGKSRLLQEGAAMARSRGMHVVSGRCWEAVDAPAYWPWIQVLRQIMERLTQTQLQEAVAGGGRVLTAVLPELFDGSEAHHRSDDVNESDRFALFDAVAALLRMAVRSEPLAILLEDLHAADEPSLSLLQFLSQLERFIPIMLLASYDDQEALGRPGHTRLLREIGRLGTVVPLRGFNEPQIAAMYSSMSEDKPSPELAQAIHRATRGNPFFVEEMIRMLTLTGELQRPDHSVGFRVPGSIEGVLRRRLESLSPPAVEILEIASVIGREFELSLLQALAELDLDPLLDLLSEALSRGIIQEEGALGRYSFSHILVRETLYQGLTSGTRMKTHRRIAEILEDSYPDAIDDHLQELAHHWFKAAQAGDADKTLRYTQRAAEDAMTRTGNEEAARLLHRAVKVAETAGIPRQELKALKARLNEVQQRDGGTHRVTTEASPVNGFSRQGDYWVITFEGTSTHLKDVKGLSYISHLLQHPGKEIHALDLVQLTEGLSDRSGAAAEYDALPSRGLGEEDELLDPTARAQYKRRVEDLQEEFEEARTNNDYVRASRIEAEIDAITHELVSSLGLGGRSRKVAGPAERARVSVTKAIREALKRIAQNHPSLGRHLRSTLKTGSFCSYTPDERVSISWQTERSHS